MENKLIIFLHIPKTGGTTVNRMILQQYSRGQVAFLHEDAGWSTEKLVQLCNQNERIRMISGHFPFGIHQLIQRPCTYFTFVRHPIDLILSMYFYILRWPYNPIHDQVVRMTFKEFVEHNQMSPWTSNFQTQYVSGISEQLLHQSTKQYYNWTPGPPGSNTRDLELAKEHLSRHFFFAGHTDRLNESIPILSKALNWQRPVSIFYENHTVNRPPVSKLDPGLMKYLIEKNDLDFQLYQHVKKMNEAQ